MPQKYKELLLKDLSARSFYGVICSIYRIDDRNVGWRDEKLSGYFYDGTSYEFYFGKTPISIDNDISKIKPYLRPMSSMTDEEYKEYLNIDNRSYSCPIDYAHFPASERIDWLNKKMFDYRTDDEGKTMIDKGIALEAPEGMYN